MLQLLQLFLFMSFLAYIFQIGYFLVITLSGDAKVRCGSLCIYFGLLIPFFFWPIFIMNIIENVKDFRK